MKARGRAAAAAALAISLARAPLAPQAQARSDDAPELSVVVDGRAAGAVGTYGGGDAPAVDFSQFCRVLGGAPSWYRFTGRVYCSYRSRRLRLRSRSAEAWVSDRGVSLTRPVKVRGGEAFVPLDFLTSPVMDDFLGMRVTYDAPGRTLALASPVQAAPAPAAAAPAAAAPDQILGDPAADPPHTGKVRVVIDPGHGGRDPGTTGHGLQEKDITLAEGRDLAKILKDDGRFDVVMTRTSDVFIPLSQRSKIANDFKADLFVSIHANHSGSRRERGIEVYFLSEKASDTEAAVVAQFENSDLEESKPQDMEAAVILSELEKTELINDSSLLAGYLARDVGRNLSLPNRGVKQARFYVLHWTLAPAVLVETAFLSNRRDAADLGSPDFRRDLARKLADGIIDYSKRMDLLR